MRRHRATGFGLDNVTAFDFNPTGGQDMLDITAYGFSAAAFASNVGIATTGLNTTVTIGADVITLVGVGQNAIDMSDFILV